MLFVVVVLELALICLASNQISLYGYKNYTQFGLGDLNILISVPHGGNIRPGNIKDRTNDSLGNLKSDFNTILFGNSLRADLSDLFGDRMPFIVSSQLHRIKMDPNRPGDECCEDKREDSFVAYNDYHRFVAEHFRDRMVGRGRYKQALLVDLHGQSHPEDWIEIGYLIRAHDLDHAPLNNASLHSSLHCLASHSTRTLEELIRSRDYSMGGLLEKKFNMRVVPSPSHKSPNGANYYSGGFITQHYSNQLNAFQIELPYSMRSNETSVKLNAKRVASAIYDFYFIHNFDEID